jgi:hypothetical protein
MKTKMLGNVYPSLKKKKKKEKIRSIMGSFGSLLSLSLSLSLSRQVAEGDKGQHATTTAAHR